LGVFQRSRSRERAKELIRNVQSREHSGYRVIGCNEGRGLQIHRANGFEAEGLELNEVAAEEARAKGLTVYAEAVEDFQPEQPYAVVVLSNVLEHSLDPRNMLFHVQRILKPGGKVWISCPNSRSWLRYVFGGY